MQPVHKTPAEVRHTIKSLKARKAPGYDEISTEILKSIANTICYPLSNAINTALRTGIYPDILKTSLITPIYKFEDKSDPNNYRPISVLTAFTKIFDTIIYKRLNNFLVNKTKQISCHQFGFRKGSNTENALIEITEEILKSLDSHQLMGGLFLDLSKAFDTINHEKLFHKMQLMGIRSKALELMKSFFKNRKQIVKWDEERSSMINTCDGISAPQGSKLSSLIFLIYINDIASIQLKGQIKLFADDSALFYSRSTESEIRSDIVSDPKTLSRYFMINKLSLNVSKTSFSIFHSKFQKSTSTQDITEKIFTLQ